MSIKKLTQISVTYELVYIKNSTCESIYRGLTDFIFFD